MISAPPPTTPPPAAPGPATLDTIAATLAQHTAVLARLEAALRPHGAGTPTKPVIGPHDPVVVIGPHA